LLEADDLTSREPGTKNASQFRVPDHVVDRELARVLTPVNKVMSAAKLACVQTSRKEQIQKDSLQRRSLHQKASKEICPPLKFPAAQLHSVYLFCPFPVESVLFWTSCVLKRRDL
jgi:hypothetical protein